MSGETSDYQIGDRVMWLYEARGGYGYTQNVAAVVVGVGRKRVAIEVAQRHTLGPWRRVRKLVTPDRLSQRTKPCEALGEVTR